MRLGDGQVALVTSVDSRPPFDLWVLPLLSVSGEPISGAEQIRLSAREVFDGDNGHKPLEAVDPASCGLDLEGVIAGLHKLPHKPKGPSPEG